MKQNHSVSRWFVAACFATFLLVSPKQVHAQSNTVWTGAVSLLWSNVGNWVLTNGNPGAIPGTGSGGGQFRIVNFGTNGNAANFNTNDLNGVSLNRIFFNSGATNYTLYLKPGMNQPTLFDFGGNVPKVENDSTNLQTIDMPFRFSGNNGGGAGEIDPSLGDIFLTTNASVTLLTNTQLRFFGSSGRIVTLNATISGGETNGCALMSSTSAGAKGPFVIFASTNSCTNTFVNGGTARLAAAGVTTNTITIGDTVTNATTPATLQLDNGLLNSSALVVRSGSTNFRTIGNSAIGNGSATFTGPLSLGTNLTLSADPAGTLILSGDVNFQNPSGTGPRTLTVSGSGDTVLSGNLTNATTGSSVLTKTNSGTLTLAGTNNGIRILYNLGGGILSITNGNAIGIPLGVNYPDKLNFTANAALKVTNSFTLGRNVATNDNAGFRIKGGNTGTFDVASSSTLILDGQIIDLPSTGSGSLAKAGNGTLSLQQSNSYSGDTTISAGVLALNGAGSISTSPNVVLASGTGFDVSGVTGGSYSLTSGQTLKGNGGIKGTLVVVAGATVSPGASIGALSFTNAPTLQGTVSMEIDRAAGPSADELVVTPGGGTLAYGGTLAVTNLGAALQLNDTFTLFAADSFSGAFTTIVLPSLSTGLAWDTSRVTVDGTIKVVCNGTLAASAGANQTICAGGSVGIGGGPTASGGSGAGYSYSWSPSAGLDNTNAANPIASPSGTTTYTVTVMDSVGCTAQSSVLVTVNARPTSVVSGSATICNGNSTSIQAALSGTGPWNVTWSDGFSHSVSVSPDTRNVSPSGTTTYTVTALSDANCVSQAGDRTGSATVTVEQGPLKWVGGDGNWDFSTGGLWQDANAVASKYCDSYDILLDDSAATASPTITLDTTVAPASLTNSSSKDYTISGTGKISGATSLMKAGSGTLALATTNDYTGATLVSAGTLLVNGQTAAGSVVTVQSNATLGGSGLIGGLVDLQAGATLAPGSSNGSIGTLTVTSSVTLAGTLSMEINKSGVTTSSDKLARSGGGLTYGGILTVSLLGGSDAVSGGETFTLFSADSLGGSFSATNLPALATGLNWWNDQLGVDGSINVNRAPIAQDKVYTRQSGITLHIAKDDLLADASDPDSGDSVSYDALVSTGNQGATVSEDSTNIYYEPINDNSDTLQYRVKDTRGGTTTKNIQINIAPGEGQVQSLVVTGGTATANFAGVPGFSYEIQRSTNLVDWATLVTTNAPSIGLFQWIDDFNDLGSAPVSAYYRLRRP